jgi:hypothetical protein
MKDYFGKRSLLVGMSENHLYFSSSPVGELHQINNEGNIDNAGEDDNE